jgi:hypothetical protein
MSELASESMTQRAGSLMPGPAADHQTVPALRGVATGTEPA